MANKKDINENINESDKVFRKVVLSWYPGHMAKTKRQIEEDLKLVDVVIEIIDARIPVSSQNPDIAQITKGKKKIIVLNKIDLANEKQNDEWSKYFKNKGIPIALVDSNSGKGIENCVRQIEHIMQNELQVQAEKGRIGRKIRAMVVRNSKCGKIIIYKQNCKKNNTRSWK